MDLAVVEQALEALDSLIALTRHQNTMHSERADALRAELERSQSAGSSVCAQDSGAWHDLESGEHMRADVGESMRDQGAQIESLTALNRELVEALQACLSKGSRWHPCDPVVLKAQSAVAKAQASHS